MKRAAVFAVIAGLVIASAALADNSGRIYGKLYTVDGDEFEGLIRWDKNEASWVDVLDATKDRDDFRDIRRDHKGRKKYERGSIKIFGWSIKSDEGDSWYSSTAQSGVRFGHLKMLEVVDDDAAVITLKSGEEVELTGSSTDIGTGIREIVLEDVNEGEIEFEWNDVERIEFSAARGGEPSGFGDRLYGTVTTRRGEEFTGCIGWDMDEVFTDDVLDGEERRRSRRIKFGRIEAIERYSSSGALVKLKGGDEMVLRGSNDVNDENRGIVVSDPGIGQVVIGWDDFEKVEFTQPGKVTSYDQFDGGKRLRGTVYDDRGDKYTGVICWDDDEQYTWELLDGEYRDVSFEIEFGLIKEIVKNDQSSADVLLKDGREFSLRGSNDVNEDNKGIFVTPDNGDEVIIEWDDFERVEFAH